MNLLGQRQSARMRLLWAATGCALALFISLVAPLPRVHHLGLSSCKAARLRHDFRGRTVLDLTDSQPDQRIDMAGRQLAPVAPAPVFHYVIPVLATLATGTYEPPARVFKHRKIAGRRNADQDPPA